MPLQFRSIIIFVWCLTHYALASAQPDDQQINTWIKTLSTKKDPRNIKLNTVITEILATDSSTWCETMERLHFYANNTYVRTKIRTTLLHHSMGGHGLQCHLKDEKLHEGLQEAYEIEDDFLQYELHLRLAQIYNQLKQYDLAAMHYHVFFDILNRNKRADFYLPAKAFYDMSYGLYYTHDYAGCIEKGLNALYALPNARYVPDDSLDIYQHMQAWNTIGLAYHKSGRYEEAFQAFDKAEMVAKEANNTTWIGIIQGNKGDVYYDLGKFDSAYVLLQFDYERSLADHEVDNAANSLQWIARIDLRKGKPLESLNKLKTARNLLYQKPQPNYLSNVYFAYSQVYAALGRADSVNLYLQRYLHLHDSIEAQITKSRTDILEMRMSNLDQIQTIKILNRQKRQISVTRNFSIAIVILLGCLGYMWMNRSRMKMKLRQQEALEAKRIAEAETKKAIEQLDTFREHLLEKNAIIEKWQAVNETKEISEDQLKRLSDLTHHLILNEEDWLRFKELFDSVYPGFFLSLRNKVPDITQAEQRMAALSKLKLTAREAANLLGISPNTVYTTRRRLRQRLGLQEDADLDPYFTSFVS